MSIEGTLRNLSIRNFKELVDNFFFSFQTVVDKMLFKTLGIVYHEYWKTNVKKIG